MTKNYLDIKKFKNKLNLGFFTSNGGVSKGDYFSLNCSTNNDDKKNNILRNLKIAQKNLGIKDKKLKLINQIHSKKTYLINKKNFKNNFFGDGLITKDKKIALGVLTADCAPIFIFDKNKSIICCLHAGWKGALKNIIQEAIKKIKIQNKKSRDIIAIIGPCLATKNFEVDKRFKVKFLDKNIKYKKYFKIKNKNKDIFDLRGLINYQLKAQGIENIYNIKKDTYKNKEIFFSHRRAFHENNKRTGRMINIISFKD